MTQFTTSKDGTNIAYSKTGEGKPLILVDGAFCHRKFGANEKLPQYLSNNFTVYSYDRRGRSESGNTLPYSPQKEYEDLQAIINESGENAYVYGISSGAALALEAVNAGAKIEKLALYEAPYITDDSRSPLPENYLKTLTAFAEQGKNGKAVKYFMRTGIGLPAFVVWIMHFMIGIMFAFAYTYLFVPKVKISNLFLKGAVFGLVAFIFAQIMMAMPAMEGSIILTAMGSLMGHIIFGMAVVKTVGK